MILRTKEELNAAVAMHVFDWKRVDYGFGWQPPDDPSTQPLGMWAQDATEALDVLRRIRDRIDVEKGMYPQSIAIHVPKFKPRMAGPRLNWPWLIEMAWSGDVEAETFEVAVCLAALSDVGCKYEWKPEIKKA